jgi:hypothetical protein
MLFWDKNSAILREKFPGLLEEIMQEGSDLTAGDLRLETAASGAPTMLIKGLYVHSPRDPEREGRRLAEACLAVSGKGGEKPGPVVVLGFGLGYAAQALAESAEPALQRPIIIVEKKPGLLLKAFELRDFSRLLSRPGVAFIIGGSGEAIISALALFEKSMFSENNPDEKYTPHIMPHVMRNRTLTGIDEQWYASVENRIRAWTMRDDVNQATLKKFGRRWVRNLIYNMSAIRDFPGISRLAGIAAGNNVSGGLPVFLAAAGPGLDSIASLLPEIHKRCIVVAVDTSMRFLLRNRVDPDFVLVVDPQFWNSRHLDRCISPVTRLIAESSVYPPVLRLPFKEKYLCSSLYPLGVFIEQRVEQKGPLGAGGSVATTAWDFARMLGAQQIWIAGLDLAFPGQRTHFKGARFEEKALAESTRLNPAETWLLHALRDGIPFKAPALTGGEVLTDRRLSLYAAWFENRFRQFPAIHSYSIVLRTGECSSNNDTSSRIYPDSSNNDPRSLIPDPQSPFFPQSPVPILAGLAMAGLEPMGAEAVLALPERREEIDRRLEAASSRIKADFFEPEEARHRGERYENAANALFSGLRLIQTACKEGIKIAEQILYQKGGQAATSREKTLAALDEINRSINDSEVKEIAGFLLPSEVLPATDGNAQPGNTEAAFRAYLESSIRLYRALADSADLHG